MLTSTFSLRKFLDTFVPGFILQLGIWYLYRPYLLKYFPSIAFDDPSNLTFSSEIKLIIFLIAAISLGIIINHMSDIAVALNYFTAGNSKKDKLKRWAKKVFWIFTFHKIKDARVESVHRYLNSKRKDEFIKMSKDWAWALDENFTHDKDLIIIHQHICSRIRVISKQTELLYEACFAEVAFASSLFTTFSLLLVISLPVIPLNNFLVLKKGKQLELSLLIPFALVTYALAVIFNYSLRRRFRHFCSQITTIGLHIHSEGKKVKVKEEDDNQDETTNIKL